MSLDLESLRKIIDPVTRVAGVEGFVISSSDGLPLFSSLTDKDLEEKVAALTAVLSEVGNRASTELGKGEAEWITVNAPDGSGIIYTKLGEIGYMAVLFGKDTRLGVLLYTLKDIKRRIAEAAGFS
ncbi:roadblock/LC7 domain-containing protein [Thermofilum pendens]|uniref:Roadblock/LC7 family protein n=1 Tax=Thermofilum pendens (strain DSM 2475 / Hrk 5) TaxID=368408 RepID=A1RWT4_THEPD|nr:roadblock/LC7 domain-containing protein [Thermofilum pendens]ABL77664.1 Roadblock/LC7 family protein [Thermofilum pendens Hrk 5]